MSSHLGAEGAAGVGDRRPAVPAARLVARQVRYEQLAFWRNPIGAIFTVGFSVVFLVLLGSVAGGSHSGAYPHVRLVAYYVGAFVAYGVMAASFSTLAISLVNRRETGLLKRIRLSPLPSWALVTAISLSTFMVCLVQVVLLLVVGRYGYSVAFPENPAAFVVTVLAGVLAFTALGVAISTVIPNQDAAGPVTSVVFFVLLFLSGLWFPIGRTSALAQFAGIFPIRHFILAVLQSSGVVRGPAWDWSDLWVIAAWGAAAAVVAIRRFSWSPRHH